MGVHENDMECVLFSQEQLAKRVQELADEIKADCAGEELLMIGILKGSFIFMSDLIRCLDLPCAVDFMAISSYGSGTSSSGRVRIIKDLSEDISGKNVLIVEDILDSGNTLYYLLQVLNQRNPASIRLCTLLDKPDRRVRDIHADYCGFSIPDAFVVGYGLDYAELYRGLPYIGILKPSVYE